MSSDTSSSSSITQEMLVEYARYPDAQRAVDTLSDEGFPVKNVSIVWSRLRQIEYVTGRRTIATAARDGALTGLWFGGFLGLLLSLFVELDENATAIGVIVTYAVVAAAINAVFTAFRHWSQRGERDFSTKGKLDAEAYEIWVDTNHLTQARGILGITTPRHADPDA